jgi:hypothetical protein
MTVERASGGGSGSPGQILCAFCEATLLPTGFFDHANQSCVPFFSLLMFTSPPPPPRFALFFLWLATSELKRASLSSMLQFFRQHPPPLWSFPLG